MAVALARARARPGRGLLAAAGVAAATALLGGVAGGGVGAGERTVQERVAALPGSQRAFRVDWFGLPPDAGYGSVDRRARSVLHTLSPVPAVRVMLIRDTSLD